MGGKLPFELLPETSGLRFGDEENSRIGVDVVAAH
jgi:hypothetical protein